MVDNVNPTSQFHPYRPERSAPQTDRLSRSGLGSILGKLGIDWSKIGALSGKARRTAQNQPGMLLGGLAALVIGAGLMRRHSMSR